MDPALKRARALARATERSAARGARQEAELRHENRPMIFVGSPLPRHEILDRTNTVRFAGGDVPASNTYGAHPELVTVDPLNVTRALSQADRLNHANAIYTEGALEDGETFAEWDIYSGASDSVEDEIVAMLDGDIDTSQETIADRVETGTADLLDLIVYLHLETGEDIASITQRLMAKEPAKRRDTVTRTELGKPKLTKVQERGREKRRAERREEARAERFHGNWGSETYRNPNRGKVRSRKQAWLNGGDTRVREIVIPPPAIPSLRLVIVSFIIVVFMHEPVESDSEEVGFEPIRESPPVGEGMPDYMFA